MAWARLLFCFCAIGSFKTLDRMFLVAAASSFSNVLIIRLICSINLRYP